MKTILIVAGEASADRYGARLVRKLRRIREGESLRFFGTGGDEMEKAGVRILCHVRELANIGPREALAHFRTYYDTFRNLIKASLESPPAVAVLLDFPEFNLRLAKKLKRAGIKVIYYISPQIWAWRTGRVRIIRDYVDKMLVILPFEEQFYRSHGVDVEFVGHPLLEDFAPEYDRRPFLSSLNLDPARKTIALLPGSRSKEIGYLLPIMLCASVEILRRTPCQFLISVAPSVDLEQIRQIAADVLQGDANSLHFKIVDTDVRDILANSDFGIIKSGTSTLEAALVGTPFLIVYKISSSSWYLGNILIRSPFKGLVNLIAGEEIVPEYFQGDASTEAISNGTLELLHSPERCETMRCRLSMIRDQLSERCASEKAAAAVDRYLGGMERFE